GGSPASLAYPPVGDPTCKTAPNPDLFSPHGIDIRPGPRPHLWQVAVVAHGQREAIELFVLSGPGRQALLVWQGCIPFPEGIAGNDVTFAPDGGIVATNYQPTMEGLRGIWYSLKGGVLKRPTGDVLTWRPETGWRHVPGTAGAGPNGVAVTPDGKWIVYAESGSGPIRRVPFAGLAEGETPRTIETGGHPDNFSWTARGTLLNAVHTSSWAFTKCVFGQRPCRSGWSVIEIDPEAMTSKTLFSDDGATVGAVTAATEIAGRTYLAAIMSDRIGVWNPGP
ncbi:MAG: hypothetical protein KC466_07070, partial [Myxococcales bacterium]|nr:hypothetical protein [Myxococcales bacterium]